MTVSFKTRLLGFTALLCSLTLLAVPSKAQVSAFGANFDGQLGDGTTDARLSPVTVTGLTRVVGLAGGQHHSLALQADGTVRAWGRNDAGQLGDGTTTDQTTAVTVAGLTNITSVAAGAAHSLALRADGKVLSWGTNTFGVLGLGLGVSSVLTPTTIPGLSNIIAISTTLNHNLALAGDGSVWAWGVNSSGQLGDGTTTTRYTPVKLITIANCTAVAAGTSHSLALRADGLVFSWGSNSRGELGNSGVVSSTTPVQVQFVSNFRAISAGNQRSGGISADGGAYSWGASPNGDGVEDDLWVRFRVIDKAIAISVGNSHTVVLRSDGTVVGWGFSTFGQLGDGTTNEATLPTQAVGLTNITCIAAGGDHTLVSQGGAPVRAFGHNYAGQVGDGTTSDQTSSRRVIGGLSNVVKVAGGATHSLALRADGTVWAWGNNFDGQLGNGTFTNAATPVQVSGLTNVIAIAAGEGHSIALKSDGKVWAWGRGNGGQLGNGNDEASAVPTQVSLLNNVVAISTTQNHCLAVTADGLAWAWGLNSSGQFGNGSFGGLSYVPVQVSNLTGVTSVAAGGQHSLARCADGTVWASGLNTNNQLNISGSLPATTTPAQVRTVTFVSSIAAGDIHSMARIADGTVWCWGSNGDGQLGDGTTSLRLSAVQATGLTLVSDISAGTNHSLARKSDGTVWAWGRNGYGALGDGTVVWRFSPVQSLNVRQALTVAGGWDHTLAPAYKVPSANAGSDQILSIPHDGDPSTNRAPITLNATGSSDPDGDTITYFWYENGVPIGFTPSIITGSEPAGTWTFTLVVTDPDGTTATDDVVITVNPEPNTAPVANAGADQHVASSGGTGSFTLDGTASSDPDGDSITYEWKEGSTSVGSTATLSLSASAGPHTYTLTVTDSYGASTTDTVTIFVNRPPVANAGPDQTVTVPHDGNPASVTTSVTLDGSGSSDPDGDTLTYDWKIGTILIGSSAIPTIGGVPSGTHVVTLTVTDPSGLTSTDTVTITVLPEPNAAPIANAGPDQTVSLTKGNTTTSFTLDGSASSDPDGDSFTYQWKEGSTVLGSSATLSLTNRAAGTYTFTLTVTDSYGAFSSDSVQVTVAPYVNHTPVARAGSDQNISVPHDGDPATNTATFTLDGSASSDSDGDTLTYTWKEGATTVGTGSSISLSRAAGLYFFTLTVDDGQGGTSSDDVMVYINPEFNVPPVADAGPDQTVNVPHGSTTASITLDGSATIDDDGDTLIYEWKEGATVVGTSATLTLSKPAGTYTFTLKVTDSYGANSTDDVVITVGAATNSNPIARAGTDQNLTVAHDGNPATNTAPFTLNGSASSDPDGDTLTYEWKQGATVVGSTASLNLSRVAGNYTFTLTVTDGYGGSSSDDVLVLIKPEPNQSPVANAGPDQSKTTSGGSASFTLSGSGSSDPDGDTLTYEWKEGATVVGTSSSVNLSKGVGVYTYTLKVTDPYGSTSTDTMIVTVTTATGATAKLSSVSIIPMSLYGGTSATGTVTLTSAAVADTIVALSTAVTGAHIPASVTVLAGNTTATFAVTADAVSSTQSGKVTATSGSSSKTSNLTIKPMTIKSITRLPSSILGGGSIVGTVNLIAVTNVDVVVTLSSDSGAAHVSASVTVLAGSDSANFTISTDPVVADVTVHILATLNGQSVSKAITISAPKLNTPVLTPNPVVGGNSVTGTVSMTGPVAVDTVIQLSIANMKATLASPTVTIPAGSTSANFSLTTAPTSKTTVGSVTAKYMGQAMSAKLTVNP